MPNHTGLNGPRERLSTGRRRHTMKNLLTKQKFQGKTRRKRDDDAPMFDHPELRDKLQRGGPQSRPNQSQQIKQPKAPEVRAPKNDDSQQAQESIRRAAQVTALAGLAQMMQSTASRQGGGAFPSGGGSQMGLRKLGRMLQKRGFRVGENPHFGGVASVHSDNSWHYKGRAIDVNWGPGGSSPEEARKLANLAKKLQKKFGSRILELYHPGYDPVGGHEGHLHLALAPKVKGTGGAPRQNMALAKRLARSSFGWGGQEWKALRTLGMLESGWRTDAANPTSSARGIPQAMMSVHFGEDWQNNPEAKKFLSDPRMQIEWMLRYIKRRYGSPTRALQFHRQNNYY